MLGTLATWLRILGFDTFYANSEISDSELLQIARNESRIIVTRDKELIFRGKKKKLDVIEVRDTDLDEQLIQIFKITNIDDNNILSRCTLCNAPLQKIKKKDVIGKVPEKVFENKDVFWYCSDCNKYYWMGSHYDKIMNSIEEIKKKTRKQ